MPAWKQSIADHHHFSNLPNNVRTYIQKIVGLSGIRGTAGVENLEMVNDTDQYGLAKNNEIVL